MRIPLWKRIRVRLRGASEHETDYEMLGHVPGGLEAEYLKVLEPELRRWGVPASCASIEVRQVALTPHGRGVYAAVIQLFAWDQDPALHLLLGLPFLERRARKSLQSHWLLDVSHFAGMWLHTAEQLQQTEALADLRKLLAKPGEPRNRDAATM